MKRILFGVLITAVVVTVAFGATQAYFFDTETSTGNTFTAGTLDLDVDGNNGTNTVKFTVTNLVPGNQPVYTWHLNNVGSINGYLDIHNIAVSSNENTCIEPETSAGDATCTGPGSGELAGILGLDMFIDYNCDGLYTAGDNYIYSGGYSSGIAADYDQNELITAGGSKCVTAQFNWLSTANDNLAMGDDMTMDMTFELGQTAGQ